MPTNPNKLSQFWQELKRRRVIHVIVVYATVAFVIIELINNITEPLKLPEWTPTLVIIILLVGFPLVIIFSWIFDVTPEGLEKTKPLKKVEKREETIVVNSWRIAVYVCIVIITGLLAFNILSNRSKPGKDRSLEKSIAVLPFYYYNIDQDAEDIGDAFANEIITQLYKIKGFDRIISHTSTLKYKGADKLSMTEIGNELNANFIIEGSLERQHEDVSIQIQIIQADSDSHIWADKFTGEWDEIFTIRADIAKKVASELKTILSPDEIQQIEKEPTENPKAYDLYLLGNQYSNSGTEEAKLKAISFYEAAIELDPGFALAYTGIAYAYMGLFWNANWSPNKAYQEARLAVLKALEIDNQLAEAHTVLGNVLLNNDWDLLEAEKEFNHAIDLNPNLFSAYEGYADLLLISCRFSECHLRSRQALELNPNSNNLHNFYGVTFFYIDQADSAISYLKKRIEISPNSARAHYLLGYVYLEIGDYDKSIEELELAVELFSGPQPFHFYLGIAYARTGMINKVRNQLEQLNKYEENDKIVSFGKAVLLAELGETDQALYWLEEAYKERYQYLLYLKPVKVMFSTIRSDPRFIEIYQKVWPNDN